jgi:hypothetical protein
VWKDAEGGIAGDIVRLQVPGTVIIILNSYDAASRVMDKRAHSDRPYRFMVDELYVCVSFEAAALHDDLPSLLRMGWSKTVMSSPCSDRWRKYRKYFNGAMGKRLCLLTRGNLKRRAIYF